MKILFVGLGSIGGRHLRLGQTLRPEFEYFALRTTSGKKLPALPRPVHEFHSFSELAGLRFDQTWICNPSSEHVSTLENLRPFCDNFFCEKPLAHRCADLDRVEKLMREKPFRYTYGAILRHHPLTKRIVELLGDSRLGRPLCYAMECGSHLSTWRGERYQQHYSSHKERGGGVALDLIHEFDLAAQFFGANYKLSGLRATSGALEIDSDDICLALAVHENARGTRCYGNIQLNYLRPQPRRRVEIVLSNGLIEADYLSGALAWREGHNEHAENLRIELDGLYTLQAQAVFASLDARDDANRSARDLAWDIAVNRAVLALPVEATRA